MKTKYYLSAWMLLTVGTWLLTSCVPAALENDLLLVS